MRINGKKIIDVYASTIKELNELLYKYHVNKIL